MATSRTFPRLGLVAILVLSVPAFFGGCSSKKEAKVSGKVTYNGKPVTGGKMMFHPSAAGGQTYTGEINSDGTFTFVGVPTGEMKVTIDTDSYKNTQTGYEMKMPGGMKPPADVMKPPPGVKMDKPDLQMDKMPVYVKIPAKYADVKTTTLTWNIEKGSQSKDLNLTD